MAGDYLASFPETPRKPLAEMTAWELAEQMEDENGTLEDQRRWYGYNSPEYIETAHTLALIRAELEKFGRKP